MNKLNIFITCISIIASGLISWLITSIYYKKTNRKSAFSRLGKKIYVLLWGYPTKDGVEEFLGIISDYEFSFLPKKKQRLILGLYHYYRLLALYSEEESKALSINDYFFHQLKKYNIDESAVLIQGYELPRIFKAFLQENGYHTFLSEKAKLDLWELFNSLLTKGEELPFSCMKNISIEIKTSRPVVSYHNNWKQYERLEEEFNKAFYKDIPYIWHEMFLENEGYPF